ncbi:MAG: hypothetical protein KME52_18375 [Desmonostoc geniculatum HA4340-LM1]|jgi:hypothetical protein|nr:hypothetical protein [Desmonostoc geniculatum HA4340-LM1]
MTHPNYTHDLLKNFSRSELHEICDRLSIPRRRSKTDCIADILANQPQLQAAADLQIQETSEELVDDYLFHDEQPANLPKVGETHFIGDILHYLGEAMNCVNECIEVRANNGNNSRN